MSNSTSPLTWYWVDRTFNSRFNSRSYAETLLRPDLESGLITQHDFNLATTYLPGYQRFYPSIYAQAGIVVYAILRARRLRRPRPSPTNITRAVLLGLSCTFGGFALGVAHLSLSRSNFTKNLDNPRALSQALQNAYNRSRGEEGSVKGVPRPAVDIHGDTVGVDNNDSPWAPDTPVPSPPATPDVSPRATQSSANNSRPRSVWEAIRGANAAGAKQSSWDVLRQSHERAATTAAAAGSGDRQPMSSHETDADRAQEQAQFDAMLEAERRAAGRT